MGKEWNKTKKELIDSLKNKQYKDWTDEEKKKVLKIMSKDFIGEITIE